MSDHNHNQPWQPTALHKFLALPRMPFWMKAAVACFLCALTIPPAFIFRARYTINQQPRVHFIQDMDNQVKYKAQHASTIFADGRAARPKIPGTVAFGKLASSDHFERGFALKLDPATKAAAPEFFLDFPEQVTINDALLARGKERYYIYCSSCHGLDGSGNGQVHARANQLAEAGTAGMAWVQPANLHTETVVNRPNGHLFNTINVGIRNMAGYGHAIPPADRWAIVAYMRALQLSRHAPAKLAPGEKLTELGLDPSKFSPKTAHVETPPTTLTPTGN